MKITAWHVEEDKRRLRRLGKSLEELSELSNVLARCIIQGVDEVDPSSGEVNRDRMWKEVADVYAQIAYLEKEFNLPVDKIIERIGVKKDSMFEWERLLAEEGK